jgi:capsular polysaccharide biosynthesis protein
LKPIVTPHEQFPADHVDLTQEVGFPRPPAAYEGLEYQDDYGSYDPGYESVGRSALNHPVLVAILAILGLAVGIGIGYAHAPTYSAQAQLMVGKTSTLAADQIPGLAAGIQSLASDYARLATSSGVVQGTENALGVKKLPGSLSATPVPQSSVIDVNASAPTTAQAVALANAGAATLVKVIAATTADTVSQLKPLLNGYNQEEGQYLALTAESNMVQHQLDVLYARIGNHSPSPAQAAQEVQLNNKIVALQSQASAAQLQANAYNNQYNSALPPLTTQEELVQQTSAAQYNGSDRKSWIEAAGLLGIIGGLVIGLAGASLVDSREARRRARAATI